MDLNDGTRVAYLIEKLLIFGQINQMIRQEDLVFLRNQLLDLLKLSKPSYNHTKILPYKIPATASPILNEIIDYAASAKIIPENTQTYRDLLGTKIMGIITPMPSQVIDRFNCIKKSRGIKDATDDFYKLCKKSNYIWVDRISKNLKWDYKSMFGDLEITINLTKPEKDPRDIARLADIEDVVDVDYPKCLLCPENVGYAGRLNHPARQNHRVLPITLTNEKWYFQFSPYVYYNQHCIVLKGDHSPMKIEKKTFQRLFEFLDLFPHYFIGSNADLPIVGGSILNHDHFQGGFYNLPMEKAPIDKSLSLKNLPEIKAGILNWPMSALRLCSDNSRDLVDLAYKILKLWRNYEDPGLGIIAKSVDNKGKSVPHNTITPISRINSEGLYELDLVFRNNRTTDEFPLGIFHPHSDVHHIKKENIGLIEVMGLFILPGRLEKELVAIENILTEASHNNLSCLSSQDHPLHHHLPWINELLNKYGNNNSRSDIKDILKNALGKKCERVLVDAGVFKRNKKGNEGFKRFLTSAGFIV